MTYIALRLLKTLGWFHEQKKVAWVKINVGFFSMMPSGISPLQPPDHAVYRDQCRHL